MQLQNEFSFEKSGETRKIYRYAIICAVLWTLLLLLLFVALVADSKKKVYEIGRSMALESFEKDLLFRRWGARHGGVYAPVTEANPPNFYLKDIPERDISTPSGRELTLINPAYMTRQIYELASEQPDRPQGHITSLKPVRPDNAPDEWEKKALTAFNNGAGELAETVEINGQPHLRFMRPLKTETPCLKCHVVQGYKEGDIRGGISVTFSLASAQKAADRSLFIETAAILFLWLLGLGFIWFGSRKIIRLLSQLRDERNHLRENEVVLRQVNNTLEQQKQELELNEIALHDQNYELQTIEEMLREQLNNYEISQKLLSESEERFKALSEATFGGIIIHDSGVILECNESISPMTGYTREELIGMDGLKLIAPESLEVVKENIRDGYVQRYEVSGLRKDGTIYPLAIKGKNIPYKGRSVRVIEFRDITERKRVEKERQLLEMQLHQSQKLESLGVLAGGIAHDFNNILTIILGHCYMAREDMLSCEEYKTAFEYVETAGNRAAELCRQMLTYAGKSPLVQSKVNMWLLVDEVVKMLRSAIKKNVTINCDLQSDIPEIMGDSGQLQQIVMNLIINAAEAIGDVNGVVTILLSKEKVTSDQHKPDTFGTVSNPGRYTCLEVSDTGIGMDEETQKRIFEPFYTTKFAGRGLGMSAIHGIIKSHNALLYLNSVQGEGTSFKVCFPAPPLFGDTENSEVTVGKEKASGKILLVDDEPALRDMGTTLLQAMGYEVLSAEHGKQAVEIYQRFGSEIDLVLLDLMMPVMGGIETFKELRRIDPALPIILCSGYSEESVEGVVENDRLASFVHKPYKPNELKDAMERIKR
ncbi:MAG: DUF3365 domain-containing protein [Desulfuromonadaceae bacterium]|nr:DUF3365 domain-containing protein [Desulfuromonadaceae bacterium]MDD2855912.1 DUF3365 domain-containing protein [Desulfuromonadaceae bacterium]